MDIMYLYHNYFVCIVADSVSEVIFDDSSTVILPWLVMGFFMYLIVVTIGGRMIHQKKSLLFHELYSAAAFIVILSLGL